MEPILEPEPEVEASELQMAVAYGINGLEQCTETTEYDKWLDLFDIILEELNKPLQSGSGSFPVKQAAFPEKEKRKRVTEELQYLSEMAKEIKDEDIEGRQEMEQQLDELIEKAEKVHDELEAITSKK